MYMYMYVYIYIYVYIIIIRKCRVSKHRDYRIYGSKNHIMEYNDFCGSH